MESLVTLIGLSLSDAEDKLRRTGTNYRVVCVNGEDFELTEDWLENRVNLCVENGLITEASFG